MWQLRPICVAELMLDIKLHLLDLIPNDPYGYLLNILICVSRGAPGLLES